MTEQHWSPVDPGSAPEQGAGGDPGDPRSPYPAPYPGGPYPGGPYSAPYPGGPYPGGPYPGTPYGAAPGWTPPPKPGLLPLRPLGFGQLLAAPFQQIRRNAGPVVGSGLLVGVASTVLSAVALLPFIAWALGRSEMAAEEDLDAVLTGSIGLLVLGTVVASLASIVFGAFLQGVVITDVARGTLGERARFGTLWRAAGRRVLPLIGWSLLLAAIVLVGVVLFAVLFVAGAAIGGPAGVLVAVLVGIVLGLAAIVVAVWLQAKLVAVPSLIVLERARLFPAIARSWRLTSARFWPIFGVLLLVQFIVQLAAQIVSLPISVLAPILIALIDPTGTGAGLGVTIVLGVASILLSMLVGGIAAVVQSSIGAVITVDQRMRREGLDLELQRVVELRAAGVPTGDPFAAPGSPEAAAPVPPRGPGAW